MRGTKSGKGGEAATARKNAEKSKGKINLAIVGFDNCASSLVQGRCFYENAGEGQFIPGLMHVNLGGCHVRDNDFVAGVDIDQRRHGCHPPLQVRHHRLIS